MDYIAQFRLMNLYQKPFLNWQRTSDCCAAILIIYTRSLNQRHIPKWGQTIKTLLKSMILNISV